MRGKGRIELNGGWARPSLHFVSVFVPDNSSFLCKKSLTITTIFPSQVVKNVTYIHTCLECCYAGFGGNSYMQIEPGQAG